MSASYICSRATYGPLEAERIWDYLSVQFYMVIGETVFTGIVV